jgi:probable HAF family extracellular repeat protein
VRFTTAASLVHELIEARDEKRLLRYQKNLARQELLIVDELGFVPLSQTGAEMLFEKAKRYYCAMQLNVLWLVVAAAGLLPAAMAQQTYTFTSIDYPNAPSTNVNGINSKGDVVGYYEYIDKKGSTFDLGFVRGANGTFKTFEVPGATETDAAGISNSLVIVGSSYPSQNASSGFIYVGGTFYPCDPTGKSCVLTGISMNNLIVGSTNTNAFEIKGPGQVESLPELNGKVVNPSGINSSGTIVGFADTGVEGVTYGFILDPSGTYQIVQYPEAIEVSLNGINDAGTIVGYAEGTSYIQAFVYSQGQFTDISYPGSSLTLPFGINDSGVISGTYYDGNTYHGFIATPVSQPAITSRR